MVRMSALLLMIGLVWLAFSIILVLALAAAAGRARPKPWSKVEKPKASEQLAPEQVTVEEPLRTRAFWRKRRLRHG